MANENNIVRPVDTLQFTKNDDGDLLQLVNNYTAAFNEHVMKKTAARNVIRNLLFRILPKETEKLTGNNGGQLVGQG